MNTNYELCIYKQLSIYQNEWAIYCKTSRCYIMFGSKNEMKIRVNQLNKIK